MEGSKFKLRPSALSAQVEKQQQQSKEILQQRQKHKVPSEPAASSTVPPTVVPPTASEPKSVVPPSNSLTNSSSTEVTTPDTAANSLFTPPAITPTSTTTATNGNNETQLTTVNDSEGSVSNLVVQNSNQETNGKTGNSLTANASSNSGDEATTIPGFVFGQNLAERVILSPPKDVSSENNEPISKVEQLKQQLESPATPILTKSDDPTGSKPDSVEKLSPVSIKPAFSCNSTGNTIQSPSISNKNSAAAGPSSSSAKRKYEAITGEENESNVLQIHCRLYHWEADEGSPSTSMSWKEKGRGFLKLNDRKSTETSDKFTSRLVMRTAGSLKLILNASLVSGMTFTKSSEETIRFTNHDGIYSIKGKEKDIELLYSSVEYRMRELAKKVKSDDAVTKSCEITGDEQSDPSPNNLLEDDEAGDEDTRDDENESCSGQKGDEDESTTSTVAREIDEGTSDSQTPVMSSSESSSQT